MPSKTTAKKAKKTARKRASKAIKYVYSFGKKTDGNAKMKELLGGKGANLAEMAAIGLPVPGGFTITTELLFRRRRRRRVRGSARGPRRQGSGAR